MDGFEYFIVILGLFFAYFSGAYSQLRYGIIQGRISRQEGQEEDKENIVNMLISEIEDNQFLMTIKYREDKFGNKYFHRILLKDNFEHAKSSEAYKTLSFQVHNSLSTYYRELDVWNELVRKCDGEERALKLQAIYNEQSIQKTIITNATELVTNYLRHDL